jgi:hypothetical protein
MNDPALKQHGIRMEKTELRRKAPYRVKPVIPSSVF